MAAVNPKITEQFKTWYEKPQVMVRDLFNVTPDPWQDKVLEMFPHSPRLAMKAAKGPGKTTILAWLAWNFMLTRPHPNIAATSISGDNLRDGLWKECAKWANESELIKTMFTWQTERIFNKQAPETWFMSARTWAKSSDTTQLGNTLAGLHSDYIMFLIDESGSIPPPILLSAEAALASCKEGHIVQAGNTTSLDGALYEACVTKKNLWRVVNVTSDPDDPMRSPRVSIEWAKELIASYGRDSPFVKVMVLGEWPSSNLNALLGIEDVEAAFARKYQQHDIDNMPKILGVDVAAEGDDSSIIFPRQGLVAFPPKVMRNVNGVQGAGQVARTWEDWGVDACFIDNTGGFGASWADQLETLNRHPIRIHFNERAHEPRYANRRSEMAFKTAEWVKNGGCLPNCPELVAEMTQTTYTFKGDALLLEPKKIIKAKIGRSPDHFDSLMLTFADPVAPRKPVGPPIRQREESFDVFSEYYR